jgi:Ca2+-binding RTX toxin-like protein
MQDRSPLRTKLSKLVTSLTVVAALGTIGGLTTTVLIGHRAHANAIPNQVSLSGNVVTYTGSSGADHVTARVTSGLLVEITSTSAPLTASGYPCLVQQPRTVTCLVLNSPRVVLEGHGGDDVLVGSDGNDVIRGGTGNDEVTGGLGHDDLNGGSGADKLDGGPGNDKLDGGKGSVVNGVDTDANDTIAGGDDWDWVTYLAKKQAVSVSLDDQANDGIVSSRENDNLVDVESVTGTRFGDTLVGNDRPNALYGTWGDDILYGRGGGDSLFGELGRDALYGEGGDDILHQRYATGTDPDRDLTSSCGEGTADTLHRDSSDVRSPDCER